MRRTHFSLWTGGTHDREYNEQAPTNRTDRTRTGAPAGAAGSRGFAGITDAAEPTGTVDETFWPRTDATLPTMSNVDTHCSVKSPEEGLRTLPVPSSGDATPTEEPVITRMSIAHYGELLKLV